MRLNRRIDVLEKRSGSGFHAVIKKEGETGADATERYCRENDVKADQLKQVTHISHKDAVVL